MSIQLTKKQLESILFPNIYEDRSIDIDRNTAIVTYILKYKEKFYRLTIDVCTKYIEDSWYIYEYCLSDDNILEEVKPIEVVKIEWVDT